MSEANFQVATQAIADWRDKLFSGEPQKIYRVGDGRLGEIELAPGRITFLGGAPAVGKTALAMQFVVDAIRLLAGGWRRRIDLGGKRRGRVFSGACSRPMNLD